MYSTLHYMKYKTYITNIMLTGTKHYKDNYYDKCLVSTLKLLLLLVRLLSVLMLPMNILYLPTSASVLSICDLSFLSLYELHKFFILFSLIPQSLSFIASNISVRNSVREMILAPRNSPILPPMLDINSVRL